MKTIRYEIGKYTMYDYIIEERRLAREEEIKLHNGFKRGTSIIPSKRQYKRNPKHRNDW